MNPDHNIGFALPRPLKAYRHETLISYIQRTTRHAHLSESTVLTALGHRDRRLLSRRWAHVDPSLFPALSRVTRQPESVLRERLSEWTEGLPPGKRYPHSPPRRLSIAGSTCLSCSAASDGAVLGTDFTTLEHVCAKHERWTTDPTKPAAASRDAVFAAARFRTCRARSRWRELELLAFEIACSDLGKMFHRRNGRNPVDRVWDQRVTNAPQAPAISHYYPEVAHLASWLLELPIEAASHGSAASPSDVQAVFGHVIGEAHRSEMAALSDHIEDMANHFSHIAVTAGVSDPRCSWYGLKR